MIRRPEKIGGVTIAPAPATALGGELVELRVDRAAALDRDELEQLREVIDEALR